MSTPTARNPHTITLCWTPDQNGGRVSTYPGRAPLYAVLGLVWAGEHHDEIATDHGLSRTELAVLVALATELRPADEDEAP